MSSEDKRQHFLAGKSATTKLSYGDKIKFNSILTTIHKKKMATLNAKFSDALRELKRLQ